MECATLIGEHRIIRSFSLGGIDQTCSGSLVLSGTTTTTSTTTSSSAAITATVPRRQQQQQRG